MANNDGGLVATKSRGHVSQITLVVFATYSQFTAAFAGLHPLEHGDGWGILKRKSKIEPGYRKP